MFKELDYIVYGSELTRELARKHSAGQEVMISMQTVPKTKQGEIMGEIVSHEFIDRRNYWRVVDINGNHWSGESMRKDVVRFTPVDTEDS